MSELPRTPSDVEKSVTEVLGDLSAKRIDGSLARQIKGAADQRIKDADRDDGLYRATR